MDTKKLSASVHAADAIATEFTTTASTAKSTHGTATTTRISNARTTICTSTIYASTARTCTY